MTIEELNNLFNNIINHVSLFGTSDNKLFDHWYKLCKEFVTEVDKCYINAKEAEYETSIKSRNTSVLEER